MTFRLILSTFLFCVLGPFLAAQEAKKKPNFVIIMADDLGYGDISCFDGWIKTPNLDKLAKSGMKLTDFHSSGAVCSPTRAGLMTGRYQQRAGIPGVVFAALDSPVHKHGLQHQEITFAELLKQAGYATGIFGKWHLGYYPQYNPTKHGFDKFNGYVSGNVDFFSHVDQAGTFDWWQQAEKKDEKGYVTHLITKHAVAFIEKNKDRPFCLYLPHEAPHYPYQGPKDKAIRKVGKKRGPGELKKSNREKKRAYKEMVEEMDSSIGAVIGTLEKHGLRENTLVLFFSDNGATRLGSNGVLRGFKSQLWEGGHRVPFIANWPGRIPAGKTNDSLAISIDVMPTILAIAGVSGPENHSFDGRDLSPILLEGKTIKDRKLFWQHGNSLAMRDGPWVLVRTGKKKATDSLFHLEKDLSQKTDLARKEPERTRQMRSTLLAWHKEVTESATVQPGQK